MELPPHMDAEHLRQTTEALTTLGLCQHGQVVALVTAVETLLAVMCKRAPDLAPQLNAHLLACAQDHRDPDWHPDQRSAFDNQVQRLQTLLSLLDRPQARAAPASGRGWP